MTDNLDLSWVKGKIRDQTPEVQERESSVSSNKRLKSEFKFQVTNKHKHYLG